MIFYGDRVRRAGVREEVAALRRLIGQASRSRALGIERHGARVAALIAAGELAQGLLDDALKGLGAESSSPVARAIMRVVSRLAGEVGRSWEGGFARNPATPDAEPALAALDAADLPEAIDIRLPEGYAHYAVYPEAYWASARSFPRPASARVIGIRSIGTSLSAAVAAALDAPVPSTVRPGGPPFARTLRVDAGWWDALGGDRATTYAIVDEGPGLSGSSFGAVADALEDQGVAREKLLFLPSHANDLGPMASDRHRARWAAARRPAVTFDDLALRSTHPSQRLDSWVEDIVGPLVVPVEDASGGLWRDRYRQAGRQPPADPQNERRKFLLRGAHGLFLLKFAGLGAIAERKFERQRDLARAGFANEPLALRHGFLVERWRDDLAHSPDRDGAPPPVDHLGRYVAFRARHFAAAPEHGASLPALLAMARTNAAERFGEAAARSVDAWAPRLADLARSVRRVATDGRLHAWEWLATADGRWLKTDAVDHCVGHDLIGCQDAAWDLAGAAIEFDLSRPRLAALSQIVEAETGGAVRPDLLAFYRLAYAAFQLGAWTLAAARDEDRFDARRTAERYARALERALG